jgi:2-keto-4-pentenoate hydratase/2-oxohepta-3-ene-1,7-dioic acid hydratase in catechol pathway
MKIARGKLANGEVSWLEVSTDSAPTIYRRLKGNLFQDKMEVEEEVEVSELLTPIEPRVIICIGLNYRSHAESIGIDPPKWPVIVPKGINAVLAAEQPILLPRALASHKVDYEGELAVIIGRDCKNATPKNALEYVLGYTCVNDVSARDWQFEWGGGQWARGKQFDTFCPLGPWLVTADEIPDPSILQLETRVNGDLRQRSSLKHLIFSVPELITFLSGSSTLVAGTVILTGTPFGVGMKQDPPSWLKEGDLVQVEIDRIGLLSNRVATEAEAIAS